MTDKDFRAFIMPLKGKASAGKWDWRVVVQRLTDGVTKTEKCSGGWLIAEAVANRLMRDLGLTIPFAPNPSPVKE